MQNTKSFKILLERCGNVLACRLAVSCALIKPDEFVGFVLGYIGEGHSQIEPFHACFKNERATRLMIGDLNALTKKIEPLDTQHSALREAFIACGETLMRHCVDTTEGFWQLRRLDALVPQWLKHDPDCAIAEIGALDDRVWTHISAHLGVPVGLEA